MPKLISTTGGRDEFIADDDPRWQQMVQSGGYQVADGETASIVDAYGHQTVADVGIVQRDEARGVANTIEGQDVVVERARKERLKDETSTAGAFTRNLGAALTFDQSNRFFDEETLEADALHHETASLLGTGVGLVGGLFLGNDLGLGKLLGYGSKTSAAARELAIAGDALTAERVGSSLTSASLLGSGGKVSATERSLARAGKALEESTATRGALRSLPDDLATLDAKGLKAAAAEERAALKTQAEIEKQSLDELRIPQREELASRIGEMHHDLQANRPIFHTVQGADVEAIAGVKDIKVQLAKSFKSMRAQLDSPLSVARDPSQMVRSLEMRQVALEALQAKSPEIRAVLGNDARAIGLDHVDDALMETREQIAMAQKLHKSNPVTGMRLAEFQNGVSPRLTAIEAAQEALTKAPEAGLIQKGAKAGVFAGVTALAHAIPGVGAMAPFVGKWAGDAVGKTFESLSAAKAAVSARSQQALDAFLNVTTKTPAATAVTATQVLAQAKFGDGPEASGKKLPDLFKARSAEIRNQTMYGPMGNVVIRPEARQAIAKRLAPIALVNPLLADKLETLQVRKTEFISSKIPRQPDVGGLQIGPDNWKPSDLEMRSWARTIRAVEDPGSVEDALAHGMVTPEAADAYRSVYPERFAAMQRETFERVPQLAKKLPLKRCIALSIFTGVPLIPALQPNILQVLQGNFAADPGSQGGAMAPRPAPSFGALGSMKSADKPTASQARAGETA